MAHLITDPNLDAPDDFYADLIAAHDGKSDAQSEEYNARLIIVLANHIGDPAVLREALAIAQ